MNNATELDPITREARRAELTARKQAVRAVLARAEERDSWPDAAGTDRPRLSPVEAAAAALVSGAPVELPPSEAELRREVEILDAALGLLDRLDANDALAALAQTVPDRNARLRAEVVKVGKWLRAAPSVTALREAVGQLQDAHLDRQTLVDKAGRHATARVVWDTNLEDAGVVALKLLEQVEGTLKELTEASLA